MGSYGGDYTGPAWYRVVGSAGSKLTENNPGKYNCGSRATGYLTSGHPSLRGSEKTVRVCFQWSYACQWQSSVKIINCGDYFVYYLPSVPMSTYGRYCTE